MRAPLWYNNTAMENILDSLNEEQIKPVQDTQGQVLVLAGAGSGKTRVLTSRIAYILQQGLCSPSNILAITFTNKAAKEMKERVEKITGDVENMWICTIHSMCVRILRRHGESIGVKSNFSIYSETERNNVIKKVCKELDLDEKLLKSVKFHVANAKMLGLAPDTYSLKYKDETGIREICQAFERYDRYLNESNALDFDDLLIKTLSLLRGNAEVRDYLSDKFKYVLVDEFQDTNAVQYGIIRLLASKHGNLFAVGDDDQSIYGWRGAEIENILRFDKDYPQAKVYKLQRNYRSTKSILNLANIVIAKNSVRHDKKLWTDTEEGKKPELVEAEDEKDEALYAAKIINAAVYAGGNYSDFAVLMRINALTRAFEQEFGKYGIPYKVFGGFKFFERKEIKDVLAYMRLISNPFDDEAFLRIVNVPRRGIGARTIEIMESYSSENELSLYDACIDADDLNITSSARSRISDFAGVIKQLVIEAQTSGVSELVKKIIASTDLKSAYDDGTDEGDAKLANLDEFQAAVDDFVRLNPDASLEDYLHQITLASDTDDMDDGNYVTLATIHSVKGLEFNRVFICGLEDGIMPTSRAKDDLKSLEEERRLMYVAVTRAKNSLWLTRSKSRYIYGHREDTLPSRFLREMRGGYDCVSSGVSYGRKQPRYGESYGGYKSGYGGDIYGGYKSGYGSDGYDGDFWEQPAPSRGKGLYSSDEGYLPDPEPSYKKKTPAFSAASSFGGGLQKGTVASGLSSGGGKNYFVGCKVKHPKFGYGTVIALKNGGKVVDIAFENQGIKELSATIAPLEIV